jgi:arsenate reductase
MRHMTAPNRRNTAELVRRLTAEALGTGLLVTVVVGSGIAAQELSPQDVGLQLLENSTATFLGLTVLILLFGPVSGAHFNPVVSAADWVLGRRNQTGLGAGEVGAYTVAQVFGAVAGAELANLMYQVPLGELSTKDRTSADLWLGEVVATAGLVLLIFALARSGRGLLAAPAVGAYIGAAYWFTSSTSFANPAVTIGRVFSDTFAGIAPGSVPGFVVAQVVGGVIAVGLVRWFYPAVGTEADRTPDDVVVPHPPRGRPTADSPEPREHHVTNLSDAHRGTATRIPQVVFACVRNGGRSVISRVLTEHYADGRVRALSAGTQPGEHIHQEVADVLEKLGLDTSLEHPKLLTRDTIASSAMAITLGCGEECPYVPGVRYVDWPVEDPGGQDEATVRRIVADLDERVRNLLRELVPDLDLPPSVLDRK